ncbi:MAG: glucose-1-phosphate adenylyltransferase [Armatimonadetes bacterium]|nr:glucose-1-phosphate adenylyltransferase [Armatimonadota bacterium]
MIMAGGASESLSVLTEPRAEPALPFGGKYRIIDFALSNLVNSDIYNVGVLTQYRPRSLNAHIGTGKPWDLDLGTGGVALLQPFRGGPYGDWQRGTADAVRRNLEFVQMQTEDHVLILAGDHIYLMDYRPMLRQHYESNADLTVAVRRVNPHEAHRFGMVSLCPDGRIEHFQEKPRRTRATLASMGIYAFRKDVLLDMLVKNPNANDFAKGVLPSMLNGDHHRVFAHQFMGYWEDVGTVQSYWEANMSLLAEDPALDLYDPQWVVHTRSEERGPVRVGPNAQVDGNLISNGCRVEGIVQRSVLSPGVYVAEGAVVKDSVVFNDAVIEAGAVVDRCIVDKRVVVGAGAQVGSGDDNTPNREMPERLNTGITLIGREAMVPEKLVLGRNVIVHPFTAAEAYGKKKRVASGSNVGVQTR